MLKGDITVGDIWEINPFGNNIMTFSVKGATIKKMMTNNIRLAAKDEELSGYDMIIFSGMVIRVNPDRINNENDDFILSLEVNGTQIDLEKNYSVVTNSYTASQAKKYFGEFGEEINATDTNVIDRDALLEAVKQQKVINNVFETRLFLVKDK
jgi:2',3'-cyclic-nucleotide 2'-phosphodiesterase/3'-nucleotidase